jgi:hypothetical protein
MWISWPLMQASRKRPMPLRPVFVGVGIAVAAGAAAMVAGTHATAVVTAITHAISRTTATRLIAVFARCTTPPAFVSHSTNTGAATS